MNRILELSTAALAAFILTGCQPKAGNLTASEGTVAVGPQFSAKHGLLVPEDTRRSIGLKLAEVTEQKIGATIEIQLRVHDVTPNVCRASGAVTPEQAKELKPGEPLQIHTRDGQRFTGKITGMRDQLQLATGLMEVLAEIPSPAGQFSVGDFLTATGTLESVQKVTTIPRAALLEGTDGYSVYTVSGEHLVRTPVKVGVINAERVEIKDGLYAGDQVVLEPVMSLWLTELAAVKSGQACCAVPASGK